MAASSDEFSVVVLASDLGIDARPFLSHQEGEEEQENWHDCSQYLSPDEDFSDLDLLQFFRLQGSDKHGNRIYRIVGKYFPAPVVSGERLKKYIFHKICSELSEGPFCIVYLHSTVQKEDNSPGITILRWIYEELPSDIKDRLQALYFVHPGLRSRLVFATLGRLFLSGDLYWKIKYVSRLQYLWDDIKKGEVEIPDFVKEHDDVPAAVYTSFRILSSPIPLAPTPPEEFPAAEDKADSWSRDSTSSTTSISDDILLN